jgi:predicted nucleic acid-binding protein
LLTASSITWLEVWRSLRRAGTADVESQASKALSGIAEFPLSAVPLSRARSVGANELHPLDAIHLASAIAVGAEFLLTYHSRLADSASQAGLQIFSPMP